MESGTWSYIAVAATAIGIAIAAYSVGKIFSTAIEGISRNPGAEPKIMRCAYVGGGMVEAMGLVCFILAIFMLF